MSGIRNIVFFLLPFLICSKGVYSQTSTSDFIPLSTIQDSLENPLRLTVDTWDNIYVTDVYQKCIRKFDRNGNLIATLAQGSVPISVATDPEGILFFGDANTGHIYKVNANGQPEIFYTGTVYPSSITFSPDNTLYVADNQLRKVLAVDLSGNLIREIGTGTFIYPTGIAFDIKNNRLLVAEHGGVGGDMSGCGGSLGSGPLVKVYLFNRQGNLTGSFGCFGNSNGKFYRVQGITVGRCGNIYLCEPYQGNINVYTSTGTYITKFGVYGTNGDQLNLPMDIAFDSRERIIISNYNNGSLLLYTINDVLPSATIVTPDIALCTGLQAGITVKLTGTAPWNLTYARNGANPVTISNISESPYVINVQEAGDYVITAVSDANASGTCLSGAAHVSFHPLPTATINCGDQSICEGDSTILPISFTGDAPWTFTYTRNDNNPVILTTTNNPYLLKVKEQGHYRVTALTGRGCTGTIFNGSSFVTVRPKPTADITTGNAWMYKCGEAPLLLPVALTGTGPWTLTYTVNEKDTTRVQTSENPYMIDAVLPGAYEVKIVSDNYCSNTTTTGFPEVVINPKPTAHALSSNIDLCPGTPGQIPIQFTGLSPWTITISSDNNIPVTITTYDNPYFFTTNEPGTYRIIAVSDSFCTAGIQEGSFTVTNRPAPTASFSNTTMELCTNQTADIVITFTGTAPFQFTFLRNGTDYISGSSNTPVYHFTVNVTGTYQLISLNDAFCNAVTLPPPVNVVPATSPVANFTYKEKNLKVRFINTSTNAVSYLWQFGDNTTSTATGPSHTYSAPGIYTVTLYAYGVKCGPGIISKQIQLSVSLFTETTIVSDNRTAAEPDDVKQELSLQVYPNPANGIFTLVADGIYDEDLYVDIINWAGQKIRSQKINTIKNGSATFKYQLDIRPCANGVYVVRLRCRGKTIEKLIIVTGD